MSETGTLSIIVAIDTPSLGDRSYLAHDGRVAVVVDPQRDIDRVLTLAEEAGVRITHILETHIHNDYVTGGLALTEATGAAYLVNGEDEVSYDRTPERDGDLIMISPQMRLRVIATPGHTFTHLSYVLEGIGQPGPVAQDTQSGDGPRSETVEVVGVFTGGTLLFGATGRPDLLGQDHTRDLPRSSP